MGRSTVVLIIPLGGWLSSEIIAQFKVVSDSGLGIYRLHVSDFALGSHSKFGKIICCPEARRNETSLNNAMTDEYAD
jgi:hypothetical protein